MNKLHRRMLILAPAGLCASWLGNVSADDAAPIHHIASSICATCHSEIYKQWKGSMHANSTALKDSIHGTFYQKVVGDPTQEDIKHKASGKYPVCLMCHAPNAALDKTTKLDAKAAYAEGVNCVACHTLAKYKGIQGPDGKLQLGIKAYEISDKIQAPHGFDRSAQQLAAAGDPFGAAAVEEGSKPNPHLGAPVTMNGREIPALPMDSNPRQQKTSDACMGCHDRRNNPQGVPLCITGAEYQTSKSQVNCLACHMPISGGMADHSMGGGHDQAILERSLVMDLDTEALADRVRAKVYLKNQQPHSLPTGAPFRNMYVKVMAYDADGEVIWQNSAGHPGQDDPQSYLVFKLADDAGKDAMPPVATKLGEDTRLQPHEERTLVYDIPAKGVRLVRAEVYYNLLWSALVEKFKHLPDDLKAPVLVADAERTIGG
jgi:mono/diheme cytochrome c family protein